MEQEANHSTHSIRTHTHTRARGCRPGRLPASVQSVFPALKSPVTAEKLDWLK